MKSPRQLLLERHRATEPKLDALRREVLEILNRPASVTDCVPTPTLSLITWLGLAWREVVLRAKFVWLGMAAIWALLLVANLALANRWPVSTTGSVSSAADMPAQYREQQRLYREYLGSLSEVADGAPEPSRGIPRPHSDRGSSQPSA